MEVRIDVECEDSDLQGTDVDSPNYLSKYDSYDEERHSFAVVERQPCGTVRTVVERQTHCTVRAVRPYEIAR